MIFGHSKKDNKQNAQGSQPAQNAAGGAYPAGYPQNPQNPQGYPAVTPNYQNPQGYAQGSQGYPQAAQGSQGYPQMAQSSQGYPQMAPNQGYAQGYGGAQNAYGSVQGSYNTPAVGGGYFAQNQAGSQSQGYPARNGQGYAQNPGYAQGQVNPQSQGYPAQNPGYAQSQGYPAQNPGYAQSQGYPRMPGQGAPYGYPNQGGYPQANQAGYAAQGYPQAGQGGQGFSGYPQMGRDAAGAGPRQEIPLNGAGYVPPAQKGRRPFVFNNIMLLGLSAVLLLLFVLGLVMKIPALLWIFAALSVGTIAFFFIRPTIDTNKRLCYAIIFGALTVAAGVTLFTWSGAAPGDPTNPGSQTQATPTLASGVVVDPKTGQAVVTVAPEQITPTPAPAQNDTAATDRLESFFYYWSVNKQDDMLTLCAPSWLSSVDNAKTALFGLMANRTPLDYTVEKISGTVDDTSRTVTVTSTMDRNNGKDPVKYRLSVLMVREGDNWYVDPQSLKTYEAAETQDPATLPTATPTVEPAVSGNTVLYYNPDGGSMYHLDQNCKSTHAKYLPLKGHFTYAEINDAAYAELSPCNVCAAPLRP